jgi:Icc-related predicted phosphoesterase
MSRSPERLRIAAVGDLHVAESHDQPYRALFARAAAEADVLVLTGDLTNFGKTAEAEILAADIATVPIPVVAVLGNHDYECGQPEEVARLLHEAGARMLDGEAYEIEGVGFAGAKGFIGGFGRAMLSSFGEPAIKAFVQASVDETMKLESSLRMLRTERTLVVLHYSPVAETLQGEPEQIFPFLGSTRLAETIDRFEGVKAVVHGHAHRGRHLGHTPLGAPVYNCALPVLRAELGQEYAVIEI